MRWDTGIHRIDVWTGICNRDDGLNLQTSTQWKGVFLNNGKAKQRDKFIAAMNQRNERNQARILYSPNSNQPIDLNPHVPFHHNLNSSTVPKRHRLITIYALSKPPHPTQFHNLKKTFFFYFFFSYTTKSKEQWVSSKKAPAPASHLKYFFVSFLHHPLLQDQKM